MDRWKSFTLSCGADYIANGVIARACKLASEDVTRSLESWKKAGSLVASSLGLGSDLTDIQQQRVYHYYVPVFMWAQEQLKWHKQQTDPGPLVVCPARIICHIINCGHLSRPGADNCALTYMSSQFVFVGTRDPLTMSI
jgi:hypothetical protein